MFFEHIGHIPTEVILFFIIYGFTGAITLCAALYLLLRRGNAFAADVTPPLRLRRWAASFFGVSALGHVWWFLFYTHSSDCHSLSDLPFSPAYVTVLMLDGVTLFTTIAGTLLAMLQDRRRPVWPVFAAMLPFVLLGVVIIFNPNYRLLQIAIAYVLLLYVLFTVYLAFAVRQYGRWLCDNYADLERKEVWLSHVLSILFLLLFIFYALVDINIILFYLLHLAEIVFYVFLLWRVETLPSLEEQPRPLPVEKVSVGSKTPNIDMDLMERMLTEHCAETHLYLQQDLTLAQLAAALGTNRSYLSQYFSRQSITYNTYINNLRINYFVSRYQEVVAAGQSFTVQQLASESGYRSYSTFSLAFKQRMGQSVTAWMHSTQES